MAPPPPTDVLDAFGLHGREPVPITTGLINRTFLSYQAGERRILQLLNPIFAPEVNEDIEAVTEHLAASGLETPRLVRTAAGEAWFTDQEGGVWRVLTHVEGETVERVDSPRRAWEAGGLLGRFHTALQDLDHQFNHHRLGVHDTEAHLKNMAASLEQHRDHDSFDEAARMAFDIRNLATAYLLRVENLPDRVVHGDPKISNFIFAQNGRARCLVDLDTLARMPLHLELGDALRSWCNPAGEEQPGILDLELAGAALEGYAASAPTLAPGERAALPWAAGLIAMELAARFCADALQESYFGWDPARYPSASAHNLARARSQLLLAISAHEALDELERLVARLWS